MMSDLEKDILSCCLYEDEINSIIYRGISYIRDETAEARKQNKHNLKSYIKFFAWDKKGSLLDFGDEPSLPLQNIPPDFYDIVNDRVREGILRQLQEEGYHKVTVDTVKEGPYHSGKTLAERLRRKYHRYIVVDLSWK